jgi:hypothetical protein
MSQYDLFAGTPPHVNGSSTSRAAAESIRGVSGSLCERILAIIRESREFGMTCDQVEMAADLRHQTASARMRELALRGLIVDTGLRRKTRGGRYASVWTVK